MQPLHKTPFCLALLQKRLPVESYVALLRGLAIIHARLEQSVRDPDSYLYPALRADIDVFPGVANVPETLQAAQQISDELLVLGQQEPEALSIYLATFGTAAWRQPDYAGVAQERFGPTTYLTQSWTAPTLDGIPAATLDAHRSRAEQGLLRLALSAYPPSSLSEAATAASLNPEAGRHEIVTDPMELAAALRAGEQTLGRFPYFAARYGERGRRFSSSDSAWLASLVNGDEHHVIRQVRWLGGVLASRGMPRLLLEMHLATLHEHLCAAVPARAPAYAKLLVAAEALRSARLAAISQQEFDTLAADFDTHHGKRLNNVGALIVSAVADERAGVARAVETLSTWLTDTQRFPPDWVQAVNTTLQRARLLAAPKN